MTVAGCGRIGFAVVGADAGDTDATDAPGSTDADADLGYCASLATPPKLCTDFDTGAPLETGFDALNRNPADATTSAALDSLAYSGSSSVLMALDGATGCSYVRLTKDVPTSGDGLRLRFRFRPSQPWATNRIFANLRIGEPAGCALLPRLQAGGAGASLHVQWGTPQENEFLAWTITPALDTWSLFELAIDNAGGVPRVEIRLDGARVLLADLAQCSFGTFTFIGVGQFCANGDHEARYDDVTIDYP